MTGVFGYTDIVVAVALLLPAQSLPLVMINTTMTLLFTLIERESERE